MAKQPNQKNQLSKKNQANCRVETSITKHSWVNEHPDSSEDDQTADILQLVTIQ